MSLKDIRQALITRIGTVLPTYSRLENVFDIEQNSDRLLNKGYAVRWGEGLPATGPTRKVAYNSRLILSLTNLVETRASDNSSTLVDEIYADVETVIGSVLNATYLGIPSKMRGVPNATISAPRLIAGNKFVLIEIDFLVDHVIDINY